ncbi:jg2469 [Pararge aegeria aegeria]|uniref:Jg2469 protein n=1 Tax=Pararge aegeria aegeria TaxID=348720 RepID=A0A8S4SF85_9NEOP|nr:jg2469 [Pararge aegeria aegeria]
MLDNRAERIKQYKSYYDRGTKSLIPLSQNDPVRMKQNKIWVKSRILRPAQEKRSYWVQTENGGVYRRNRQHLMKIPSRGNDADRINNSPGLDWDSFNFAPTGNTTPATEPNVARSPRPPPAHRVTSSGRVVRSPIRFASEYNY